MCETWQLFSLQVQLEKISTEPQQFLHDIDQLFEWKTTRQRICKAEKMQIEKLWNLDKQKIQMNPLCTNCNLGDQRPVTSPTKQ